MKTFKFRGTEYANTGSYIPLEDLTKLYLVYRALDGDGLAIELLNAAKTIVKDGNGTQVWPPVKESGKK